MAEPHHADASRESIAPAPTPSLPESTAPSPAPRRPTVEEMGRPTYRERHEAANVAMEIEDARKQEKRQAPIADRHGYRNRIAQNFAEPERWAECRRLLGQLEDEPVPDAPSEDEAPEPVELVPHIDRQGRKVMMTPEDYRALLYDYEGHPDDERRSVREPFEWLELKHPEDHKGLIMLEQAGYASRLDLLTHAEKVLRYRWRHVIARNPRAAQMSLYQLERLEDFRRTVVGTLEAFRRDMRRESKDGI